jgi:Fe-S-cluster-containing hydrogenase component 2
MADKPKEEKKTEEKPQAISRRELLVGAGTGVAGLVIGGAVGYGVIPKPEVPSLALPETWIGRNIASCTGCRFCQVACSQIKEKKFQPGIARVTVQMYYPGVDFPVLCYQCGDNAKCIEACPTQALSINTSKKNNTIAVDTTKCLRTAKNGDCTLCLDKCPGAAVTFHPTTKAPLICDLCDGDPACTKVCPKGTIINKGVKMAAVSPDQIAAGLAEAYKVPPPPKTSAIPQDALAMAADDADIG